MRDEVCAFCGEVLPPQLPHWEHQGLYLCASCIQLGVVMADDCWSEDEFVEDGRVSTGSIRVLDLLKPGCTFCHASSRTGRLMAGPNTRWTRICRSCLGRAQAAVPSWVYADPFPERPPWQKLLATNPSVQLQIDKAARDVIRDPIWHQIWSQSWMEPKKYDTSDDLCRELYWSHQDEVGETYSESAFLLELRRLTLCVWEHMVASNDP